MGEFDINDVGIPYDLINPYARKVTLKAIKLVGIICTLLILLGIISLPFKESGIEMNVLNIILLILQAIISFVILIASLYILFLFWVYLKSDFTSNKTYSINKKRIESKINYHQLNMINKFGYRRNKLKWGTNFSPSILITDIRKTKVFKSEIKFYEGLTTQIIIPQEVDRYNEIIDFVKSNAEIFKLEK